LAHLLVVLIDHPYSAGIIAKLNHVELGGASRKGAALIVHPNLDALAGNQEWRTQARYSGPITVHDRVIFGSCPLPLWKLVVVVFRSSPRRRAYRARRGTIRPPYSRQVGLAVRRSRYRPSPSRLLSYSGRNN